MTDTLVAPKSRSAPPELLARPIVACAPDVYVFIREQPYATKDQIVEALRGRASSVTIDRALIALHAAGWITRRRCGRNQPPFGFPRESV